MASNQQSGQSFAPQGCTVDQTVIQELRDLQGPGEPDILQELADIFAQDTPARLSTLKQAVGRRDAAEIRRVAHSLKGSCGNLGAQRLSATCARLEELARQDAIDQATELVAYAVEEYARVRAELTALGVRI